MIARLFARSGDLAVHKSMPYRPEIDGLRALAILLVIGFHAYPSLVPGGFVGVDVFFVISGYLITGIILVDVDQRRFSWLIFYRRRINRIFPALVLVLTATLAAGYVWLIPKELLELSHHTIAGGLFSNIVLWREAGYFDAAAETKPLLHLWSLGIEEQFYIVWPLLIFFLWRYTKRAALFVIVALALISFGINVHEVAKAPVATFYLPGTRAWELLIGAALVVVQRALPHSGNGETGRRLILADNLKFCAGMAMILWPAWTATKLSAFPGWWALSPTLGCALLISAGTRSFGGRVVLGNTWLGKIGKISFPLYMWHWPLLVFSRILDFGATGTAVSLAIALLLSILTYRYVESPIRSTGGYRSALGLCFLLIAIIGGGVLVDEHAGYPARFRHAATLDGPLPAHWRNVDCFIDGMDHAIFASKCVDPGGAKKGPLIMIWGDSHAAHLYPGFLALQMAGTNIRIAQFSTSSCPPLKNVDYTIRPLCRQINDDVLKTIESIHPDVVILAADWMDMSYNVDRLEDSVLALRQANVKNIWLFGTVPRWAQPLPRYLLNVSVTAPDHRMPEHAIPLDSSARDAALKKKAAQLGIHYFSPKDALCDARGCVTLIVDKDNVERVTSFDICHLTDDGSMMLVKYFVDKHLPTIN